MSKQEAEEKVMSEEENVETEEENTPVDSETSANEANKTAPEPVTEDPSAEEAEATAEASAAEQAEAEAISEPGLEEQLKLAQQESARNLENWQRAAAELANFKRRQEEQRKLQRDRIKSEVLEGMVSALDDLDLAFQNLPEELDGQLVGWVEGFRLVQRKLDKILEEQNVMPISTEGQFDPNFHEAVSYEESEDHEEGDIIAEVRKGYQIGSRVIRPALVRVAK